MVAPITLAVVFFLLSPGVIVTIPPFLPPQFFSGRTSTIAAAVHAVVFYFVVTSVLGGTAY